MLTLQGKYNQATIMTDDIDEETIGQIITLLNSPVSKDSHIVIMPDCHAGSGCVIGTTLTITDKVIPNLVGVDIGCGMLCIDITQFIDKKNLREFDNIVHQLPSGLNVNTDRKNWGYLKHLVPEITEDFFQKFHCEKYFNNLPRLIHSLGSLGGGNHFIELDKSKEGTIYLVIHTGSRNLGLQVCQYYQKIARQELKDQREEINALINKLKNEKRESEINNEIAKLKRKTENMIDDLAYLSGASLQNYLDDMKLCQEFASWNRKIIALEILNHLSPDSSFSLHKGFDLMVSRKNKQDSLDYFETIHNYIDFEDMMLRKGSVRAHLGEKLLIPLNMAFGSVICKGLGNESWNFSAPHGAGRKMSRALAKETLSLEEYQQVMEKIFSTSVNKQTIDEAPGAYKDADSIIELIANNTVEILEIIKPIYNFKASD